MKLHTTINFRAANLLTSIVVLLLLSGCTKYNSYFVKLDNTYQLKKYDEVLIKGQSVGKVADIDLKNNQIIVQIQVGVQYPVYKDAIAEVKSVDLLGSKAVELIYSGKNKQILADKDTIAGEYRNDEPLDHLTKKMDTLIKAATDSVIKKKK